METAPSQNVVGANAKVALGVVAGPPICEAILLRYLPTLPQVAEQCYVLGSYDYYRRPADYYKDLYRHLSPSLDYRIYNSYRELLNDERVEAVVIGVEDHLHARVVLDSLRAGKHVYVIAPLCRYLPEAFEIWDLARSSGLVVQVGAPECSDRKWHQAAELVGEGRIGPVVLAQSSYMRNSPKGEWNLTLVSDEAADANDWNLWLRGVDHGGAGVTEEEHCRWPKYYRYSAGLLSRLLPHRIHPMLLALGGTSFPRRVAAIGTKAIHTDRKCKDAAERDCPELIQVVAELDNGTTLYLVSGSVNEQGIPDLIRGHKASLLMGWNTVRLLPEPAFSQEVEPWDSGPLSPTQDSALHFQNWLDAIRGKAKPNCGIELALRAQVLISLAEMSDRMGVTCLYDPATRTVRDGLGNLLKPFGPAPVAGS